MKKAMRRFLKVLLILLYPIFVITTVGFAAAFLIKTKQINDINSQYAQVQENLNKNSSESKITIDNLQQSFDELNQEVARLKAENLNLQTQVNTQAKNGYGQITGKIFPLISAGSTFNQTQLVCAENVNNVNLQYCLTVTAMDQEYTILVPVGTYQVSAKIITTDAKIAAYRAYFTEYIGCLQGTNTSACDPKTSTNKVQVKVEAGKAVANVNPIDWAGLQ